MATKKKSSSKRHHWWPQCVSRQWEDDKRGVTWLLPDGTERRARASAFGMIGNGHFIKLGTTEGETTLWDQNFEIEFQKADDWFPHVIRTLEALQYDEKPGKLRERFLPQASSDEFFGRLVECLTSIAIRSPMTRAAVVSIAESIRGLLPERERNTLIAANMRDMHRRAVQAFGIRGKATAIFSPDRELIFGDGFYHNLTSSSMAPYSPRILAPLTPRLAVLYAKPMKYTVEPRLSTLTVGASEADALNDVVQIYSRESIFYRSEKPSVIDGYRSHTHLMYSSPSNIVETIVDNIPGVSP